MAVDKLIIAAPQIMDRHITSTTQRGWNTFSKNNSTLIAPYLVAKENMRLINLLYVTLYLLEWSYTISLIDFSQDKGLGA